MNRESVDIPCYMYLHYTNSQVFPTIYREGCYALGDVKMFGGVGRRSTDQSYIASQPERVTLLPHPPTPQPPPFSGSYPPPLTHPVCHFLIYPWLPPPSGPSPTPSNSDPPPHTARATSHVVAFVYILGAKHPGVRPGSFKY